MIPNYMVKVIQYKNVCFHRKIFIIWINNVILGSSYHQQRKSEILCEGNPNPNFPYMLSRVGNHNRNFPYELSGAVVPTKNYFCWQCPVIYNYP